MHLSAVERRRPNPSQRLSSSSEIQGEAVKRYTTPSLTIPSSSEIQGEAGKRYTTPSLAIKGNQAVRTQDSLKQNNKLGKELFY